MTQRDDRVYLQHIVDAVDTVTGYLQGVAEAVFQGTKLLQDGVIRQIQIIGEAAKRVSMEMCVQYASCCRYRFYRYDRAQILLSTRSSSLRDWRIGAFLATLRYTPYVRILLSVSFLGLRPAIRTLPERRLELPHPCGH